MPPQPEPEAAPAVRGVQESGTPPTSSRAPWSSPWAAVFVALTLALGAFLRFEKLGGPSLWLDEILHLRIAQEISGKPWAQFFTGFREVSSGPENGTLYYGLQALGHALVPGEVGVRLFPAILGLLALPLMAATAGLLAGHRVAMVATFLLAVSPLHVYFSREGRPYAMLMLLSLLLLYTLLYSVRGRGSRASIFLAYATCLAATYAGIHSVPILLSFAAISGALLLRQGIRHRKLAPVLRSQWLHLVLAAGLALGLSYALYMTRSSINHVVVEKNRTQQELLDSPVFLSPLSQRGLDMFVASMTTSGHASVLTVKRSWLLLGFALLAVGLAVRRPRQPPEAEPSSQTPSASERASLDRPGHDLSAGDLREGVWITLGMFILPTGLSFVALIAVARWYGINYTSPALPAFLLLTALGIVWLAETLTSRLARAFASSERASSLLRRGLPPALLAVALATLAAPNLQAARADPLRKPDWRGLAHFLSRVTLEGEPIVIPNMWPQICLEHYFEQQGRSAEFINAWESGERGQAAVDTHPSGWLLTAGFRKTNEVRSWMQGFVPVLKQREQEMELFFFPDLATLLATRFEAGKGAVFEEQLGRMGGRFDFGGGELLLKGRGWSFPEANETGTFQWAFGEQTELALPVGPAQDRTIRFRALPFLFPDAPPQTIELLLGERSLGTLTLEETWSEYEVKVPRASWSEDANLLTLRFSRSDRPKDVIPGSSDRRSLSAAFDYLEVVPFEGSP